MSRIQVQIEHLDLPQRIKVALKRKRLYKREIHLFIKNKILWDKKSNRLMKINAAMIESKKKINSNRKILSNVKSQDIRQSTNHKRITHQWIK